MGILPSCCSDSTTVLVHHLDVNKTLGEKATQVLYFDLLTRPKMPFQGDAPEGGDTF